MNAWLMPAPAPWASKAGHRVERPQPERRHDAGRIDINLRCSE
jgi:hypothetical protein